MNIYFLNILHRIIIYYMTYVYLMFKLHHFVYYLLAYKLILIHFSALKSPSRFSILFEYIKY